MIGRHDHEVGSRVADALAPLGAERAARELSLHVDGKRGTASFSPPRSIAEDELVAGVRAFGDAAVAAFGGRR